MTLTLICMLISPMSEHGEKIAERNAGQSEWANHFVCLVVLTGSID